MRYLNAETINSLSDLPPAAQRSFKKAYRVMKLAYFGGIFLPKEDVSPVRSAEELNQAHQLVYREYLHKGFCAKNRAEMLFSPFTLHPTTITLLSRRGTRITGTCAIVSDDDSGLPCDSTFKHEVDALRAKGFKLVEIASLATDRTLSAGSQHSFRSIRKMNLAMGLYTGVLKYLFRHTDATHIIALVNPKHQELYEFIGFEKFAEARAYQIAIGNIAVPMLLSLEEFIDAQADHLPTMYMMRSFDKLMPPQLYRVNALDIAFRAELDPAYFSKLPFFAVDMFSCHYPLFRPILEYLVRNSEQIARFSDTKPYQRTISRFRSFLAPA